MFRTPLIVVALLALVPVACREAPRPKAGQAQPAITGADSVYVAPPTVQAARRDGSGMVLVGMAPAKSRLRLAEPSGQAVFAAADSEGRWSLSVPRAAAPRVFGLSAVSAGRTVQAPGYVLVAPDGRVALLRAGGGSLRLDALRAPAIGAFDFDREGGAVVSGVAPAGAALILRLDGRQAAEARADPTGRFEVLLPSAVTPGAHRLQVLGEGFETSVEVLVSTSGPLTEGPFRTGVEGQALRADWMTPGGGVQSTLIFG